MKKEIQINKKTIEKIFIINSEISLLKYYPEEPPRKSFRGKNEKGYSEGWSFTGYRLGYDFDYSREDILKSENKRFVENTNIVETKPLVTIKFISGDTLTKYFDTFEEAKNYAEELKQGSDGVFVKFEE